MSYLKLSSNPTFSKVTISLWFRVPQASMDAAGNDNSDNPMSGLVPLLVMGQEGIGRRPTHTTSTGGQLDSQYSGISYGGQLTGIDLNCISTVEILPGVECCKRSQAVYHYECNIVNFSGQTTNGVIESTTFSGEAPPTAPSYIAVDGQGNLLVNFESGQIPTQQGMAYDLTAISPIIQYGESGGCTQGDTARSGDVICCVCPIFAWDNSTITDDYDHTTTSGPGVGQSTGYTIPSTHTYTAAPFQWESGSISGSPSDYATADTWHHLLVSLDFQSNIAHGTGTCDSDSAYAPYIDSAAKLYIAMDDKNYIGWDLGSNWTEGGQNDVVTSGAYFTAGSASFCRYYMDADQFQGATLQYSLGSPKVPTGVIGIPATSAYVSAIHRVEMAELQIWFGQTLNTGVESNRRVFLDYKRDSSGRVLPDKQGKITLQPVDPKKAQQLLGPPDVLLHGSGKWIKGDNTGKLGNFDPTGTIKKYTPDPSCIPAG